MASPDTGRGSVRPTTSLVAAGLAVAMAAAGLAWPAPWAPRLAVGGLLVVVLVEAVLGTWWTRRVTAAVVRLASGDPCQEPERGLPETRAFARAVNRASREHAARGAAVEAALRDAATQAERLASVFTASSDGLLLYDDRRHIVAANPRVAELLGLTVEQLSTCPTATLAADLASRSAEPERYQALLDAHFAEPDRAREDILIVERPRRRVLKRLSTPVLHDGRVDGRVFTYTDVTADWDVDRMKSEFVATASHELRTPLTSVHAALQLVVDGGAQALQAEDRELLAISLASTERLVRLVNDLLDLSKITARRMPMALEPGPVAPLFAEVIQSMRALADARAIDLVTGTVDATPALLDRDHLLRVLGNLVGNAVKYSPAGTCVTLSARHVGDAMEIVVADQGPGIAPDQVDQLFRPFSRVGAQQRQVHGGTGLGLALSRAVVEQHGGRMWWEPNSPAGSRFVFTLPVAGTAVVVPAA